MTPRPTPPDRIRTPLGIGIDETDGAAKPRPNPMPNTAPPGFAIPEREHARLGPLAAFKRLLLDLYGNGKP